MWNEMSPLIAPTAQHCMCTKPLMSLSFVGEVKEIEFIESQKLCCVNEQEEPGPQKCLEDNFQLKSN